MNLNVVDSILLNKLCNVTDWSYTFFKLTMIPAFDPKKDRYESDTISEIESVEEVYEELDFENCDLSVVKFTKCSFSSLTFIKTKLIGIDWYDTFRFSLTMKCYGCVINYSSFVNVKLKSFVLEECTAHDVDFSEADMHNACCKDTDFQGSIFRRTNLSGADFTGAKN